VITIHGCKDDTLKAIEALIEYIRDRKTGVSKQLLLKGPDKPVGIMKELMLHHCHYIFQRPVFLAPIATTTDWKIV
jgi:hypothetical protein